MQSTELLPTIQLTITEKYRKLPIIQIHMKTALTQQLKLNIKKQVLPKVIWEERIALAQLCNKVPNGYNGTPKTAPYTLTITTPI